MRNATIASCTALALAGAASGAVRITEIRTGAGNAQYVEFSGKPGESLAGLTFLIIGDGTTGGANPTRSGVVEWRWTFAAGTAIGPNGTLLLRNPGQNPANAADASGPFPFTPAKGCTDLPWTYQASGLAADTQFERADNQTYMLVAGYSGTDAFVTRAPGGTGGQDLDPNDDGHLDVTPWKLIVDQVSLKETEASFPGSTQDWWYAPVAAGPAITREVTYPIVAVTLAGWDYQTTTNVNNGTAAEKTPNTPKVFNSNAGYGTMYLDGTNGSSDWNQFGDLDALTGTGLNASGPNGGNELDPATNSKSSLVLLSGDLNPSGKWVVYKFSMTGIVGLNLSYATRASGSSGFTTQTWQYSIDGASWASLPGGVITGLNTGFAVKTLPTFHGLDGQATAFVRCVFTGATSTTGHNRIDNVVFSHDVAQPPLVVRNAAAPSHAFMRADGAWVVGTPSTAAGIALDTAGAPNPEYLFDCGDADAGSALSAHWNPASADACCCVLICSGDPFCCTVSWDAICAAGAASCASQCSCTGDVNADHEVNAADLSVLLSEWGDAQPDSHADFNLDGFVNAADLSTLLGAWGTCPN